jgi:pimeloyl-ACP methyl ester carboxylesterase
MAGSAVILNAIEAGHGDPPLVLLHGLFGSARNFGSVQRTLARQRRTIALDLRNHGTSPHDADMRYATMAADVMQTLEHLGALPALLLGHSMGGKAAMQAALAQPDQVARLIVADIAPVANPPSLLATAEAMAALPLTAGLTRAAADAELSGAVPEPAVRGFLLQNLQFGAQPTWRIGLAEIIAAFADIQAWNAASDACYDGPALFIAGADSDYIRLEHRPLIRSWFPRARFVTLKNAGHWPHADNPEGFVAVVEAFLAR